MLAQFLRKIYNGFDISTELEPTIWKELLRIINKATVDGLSESDVPPTHEEEFYQSLLHSNEVFAAFKTHVMGTDMAAQLTDSNGKLKPFAKWKEDVADISSHQTGAWLQTEYDTAVLRAHQAADWREFERNKDVMPNLRWMPTTSPDPESTHRQFWTEKLTLPVDDPFWDEHHPGDRWNCKCSLEATDDDINRPDDLKPDPPQQGLENNPGKDGHLFSQEHPYFPDKCKNCPYNVNKVHKIKDCFNCPFINAQINKAKKAK